MTHNRANKAQMLNTHLFFRLFDLLGGLLCLVRRYRAQFNNRLSVIFSVICCSNYDSTWINYFFISMQLPETSKNKFKKQITWRTLGNKVVAYRNAHPDYVFPGGILVGALCASTSNSIHIDDHDLIRDRYQSFISAFITTDDDEGWKHLKDEAIAVRMNERILDNAAYNFAITFLSSSQIEVFDLFIRDFILRPKKFSVKDRLEATLACYYILMLGVDLDTAFGYAKKSYTQIEPSELRQAAQSNLDENYANRLKHSRKWAVEAELRANSVLAGII